MKHFLLGGSHPFLSLAEAARILEGDAPIVIGDISLFEREQWDGAALQTRLAGAVKVGDIVASIPLNAFQAEDLTKLILNEPRGQKVVFGLTIFGTPKEQTKLKQLPIQLKRSLQEHEKSVRWFAGDQGGVSSAAVSKLDLISSGYDFQIIVHEGMVHVGWTTHVQDSDSWSLRDFGRPFRDATTGMLPPKLARLMTNLAGKEIANKTLLDPFCGGGTVPMEACLLGYPTIIGTDIDARQVNGATQNMQWLEQAHVVTSEQRQRMTFKVQQVETLSQVVKGPIDVIVTEGFMGKPLNGNEQRSWLEQQKREIEHLWEQAFTTFAALQPEHGTIVASIPTHRTREVTIQIDVERFAQAKGYVRVDPLAAWNIQAPELVYAREDQRVQRRICIWEKKRT